MTQISKQRPLLVILQPTKSYNLLYSWRHMRLLKLISVYQSQRLSPFIRIINLQRVRIKSKKVKHDGSVGVDVVFFEVQALMRQAAYVLVYIAHVSVRFLKRLSGMLFRYQGAIYTSFVWYNVKKHFWGRDSFILLTG